MLRAVQAMYTVVKSIIKCHNSLVAKRGPRAPLDKLRDQLYQTQNFM